jgi:predicted Holliday junction resolvase-like endonuclease
MTKGFQNGYKKNDGKLSSSATVRAAQRGPGGLIIGLIMFVIVVGIGVFILIANVLDTSSERSTAMNTQMEHGLAMKQAEMDDMVLQAMNAREADKQKIEELKQEIKDQEVAMQMFQSNHRAVTELSDKNDELEKVISTLKAENEALKQDIAKIKRVNTPQP